MKRKLTITVADALLDKAERFARSRGLSLSSLIETSLRDTLANDAPTVAARWRGRFRPAQRDDPRYNTLRPQVPVRLDLSLPEDRVW